MKTRWSLVLAAIALLAVPTASRAAFDSSRFCVVPPQGRMSRSPDAVALRESLQSAGLKRIMLRTPPSQLKLEKAIPIKPALGSMRALVLLVDFPDTVATLKVSDVQSMLFSDKTFPTGSLKDYYRENSYGKFTLDGDVVGNPNSRNGWLRMPHNYNYYANNNFGLGPAPRNAEQLVMDALDAAVAANPNFDPKRYDSDGDGVADMLVVVHAGPGAEGTLDPTQIWSQRSSLPEPRVIGGVTFSDFAMMAEDNNVAVYAHEMAHVLGLPDLYDTSYSSSGIGVWSVMAAGTDLPTDPKAGAPGTRPSHFDAWSKIQLGWLIPTTITDNAPSLEIPAAETTPYAIKVPADPVHPEEYFLIENRWADPSNFDQYLPGSGLLIYHVDDSRMSNDDRAHPLVIVEEADAEFGLLLPPGFPGANRGDKGDPWVTGKTFGPRTRPSSMNYSGTDSHLVVENISAAGQTMTASIRFDRGQGAIAGKVTVVGGGTVSSFTVTLSQGGNPLNNAPTLDGSGGYTFPNLAEGAYTVTVTAKGYIPVSRQIAGLNGTTVRVDFVLSPQPNLPLGWSLLGLPIDFGGAKASQVFAGGADAGAAVYAYDPATGQYSTDPVLQAGRGYWVYVKDPSAFNVNATGQVADPNAPFPIKISKGWNLVGNPFFAALPWSTIAFNVKSGGETRRLDAAAFTGWTRGYGWVYDPVQGYLRLGVNADVGSLAPWSGAWFYSNVDGELDVALPSQ